MCFSQCVLLFYKRTNDKKLYYLVKYEIFMLRWAGIDIFVQSILRESYTSITRDKMRPLTVLKRC